MAADPLDEALFPFEDVGDALSLLPLAARRALDFTGLRLSLEGYQSLPYDDRCELAILGAHDHVDGGAVERVVRKSSLPPTRIKPVADPDPRAPPEQLNAALGAKRAIDPLVWSKLRALDRYALIHVMRRSIAHDDPSRLEAAAHALLPRAKQGARKPDGRGRERADADPPSSPAPPRATRNAPAPNDFEPSGRASSVPRHDIDDAIPMALRASFDDHWTAPAPADQDRPSSRLPPVLELGGGGGWEPVVPKSEKRGASVPAALRAPSSRPPPPQPLSTHLDGAGNARMVDVGGKSVTERRATATGQIRMRVETAQRLARKDTPKGDVLAAARIAGILAAKKTPELVPLCHHVALTSVELHVDVEVPTGTVLVSAVVDAQDRTGVEMEALTAVSVACLTVYDMLKGIDRDMVIGDIKLAAKSGGRTGAYVRGDR